MKNSEFVAGANREIKRLMQRAPSCHLRRITNNGHFPACECELIDGDELSSNPWDSTCRDCDRWLEEDAAEQKDDWAAGQAL